MSYNKAIPPAVDGMEEPYGIEEILYSRTDKRGIILSGNDAFRRVSGYDWDRLIGAPHRILRNPDTPRAVFHLLWKTIQDGKPICAIIKNRSSSGRWYWVMSVVAPFDGGYLSVRLKPAGELFGMARTIYARLLAAEKDQSLTPEASCARLLESLAAEGFDSYEEFMTALLQEGLAVRDAAVRTANSVHMQALATLSANIKATKQEQQALMAEFDLLQAVPTNMRIIASRLEPSGGPISAISDNYKFASTEIADRLEGFAGTERNQCRLMADITGDAILKTSIAHLLLELRQRFSLEDPARNPVDRASEMARLTGIERYYAEAAKAAILNVGKVAGALNEASTEIRRMTLGLDTIRVMGKVESGHLGPGGAGLASTIDQLDSRHAIIARHLQRLMDLSAGIRAAIGTFSRGRAAD